MKTNNMLVILGAADPEMQTIERLLTDAGVRYAYAAVDGPDGRPVRVHPGNAYRATCYFFPDDPSGSYQGPAWANVTHLVECAPQSGDDLRADVVVCDHHRPGDPGYGRPPEEFMASSSIGQVVSELARLGRLPDSRLSRNDGLTYVTGEDGDDYVDGPVVSAAMPAYIRWRSGGTYGEWYIPADIVLTAAADHCLEAAYRGRCPGVDPDELMRWRAESRAAFQRRPVESVLADVEAARKRLRDAVARVEREHPMGGGVISHHLPDASYADLLGDSIPELPEAAAREGIPFLADQTDRDGRRKVVLMAAPPELVSRFMAGDIVPGLVDYYGDPARGFAGGYVQ